jgi:hypothetical protein
MKIWHGTLPFVELSVEDGHFGGDQTFSMCAKVRVRIGLFVLVSNIEDGSWYPGTGRCTLFSAADCCMPVILTPATPNRE